MTEIAQAVPLIEIEGLTPLETVMFQLAMDAQRMSLHDQREEHRRQTNMEGVETCERGLHALAEIERKVHELRAEEWSKG